MQDKLCQHAKYVQMQDNYEDMQHNLTYLSQMLTCDNYFARQHVYQLRI